MTSDLDIWRAATLLIKEDGEDAEILRHSEPIRCSTGATAMVNSCGGGSGWRLPSYKRLRRGRRIEAWQPRYRI
jgi:hypothetical protein